MGKTYDSVDSIADFFKQRSRQMGQTSGRLTFRTSTIFTVK